MAHNTSPMRTVLVNPPPRRRAELYDRPDYGHLGLAYMAAVLREHGYNVAIVDAKLDRLGLRAAVSAVAALEPDIVGVTAMTHEICHVATFADEIKKAVPGVAVVVGGSHINATMEETLKEFHVFDYGVYGEGEETLLELVAALSSSGSLSGIRGLIYREQDNIVKNPPRPYVEDLDSLPLPAWDLFPRHRMTEFVLLTARGCPFGCKFCRPLGHRVRERSPEKVIRELELVADEFGIENCHLWMWDETFGLNEERAFRLLDMMIERGLHKRFSWFVQTRADVVTEELLKKMHEAGCYGIGLGVESGNREILAYTNKRITLEQAERTNALAKSIGLETTTFFILGHPNETRQTIHDTIRFAVRLNGTVPVFGVMIPYPGTEIYNLARRGEAGYRLVARSWEDYNKQFGKALELKDISRRRLKYYQLMGYALVFLKNRRYRDFVRFCWEFRREAVARLFDSVTFRRRAVK
jgi:anaerobic magnesium-protoporphyrin IX monomethyl ester cyclase